MNLNEIKYLSYDYEHKIMTIHLTHKKLYKNFMRDFINFKCDEKTFIEKCNKWLEFKNNKSTHACHIKNVPCVKFCESKEQYKCSLFLKKI